MKKIIILVMAFGLFVLVGCSSPAPEKKEMADSAEDIVGTWSRVGGAGGVDYIQYVEGGTFVACVDKPENFELNTACRGEFWFEDAQYFEKYDQKANPGEGCGLEAGVYEINLQPNGNLKFVKVEDECNARANWRQGRISFGEDDVEWELVP